ncbi:N-acetylmuramoyl-L-alanine amidase [Streptomyces sulfonofaciens]|uniref:N-acetylmuramoyl-L-alanine amidase n=1 Tax=Streptomyces sulfonofaciens TaxID=68272 RepID=A0A919GGT8_9ACTN|nr:N-acetylmuramoyl-L-alanine amidase [Streptomyces sulfonofaciens]GHH84485.1 N-acetylmuramoyl-L-alanine amidase [Streptomyces sulfonofaciens]
MSPGRDPYGADGSRPPRRAPAVAVAALLSVALVGWLVWRAVDGPAPHGTPADGPPPSAATARSAPGTPYGDRGPGRAYGKPPAGAPGHTAARPLAGRVVVIDPGHNPDNYRHPDEINRKVDVGTGTKECDTTGTATNAGYPEARFTLDVSRRVRALLEEQGAEVVLTQDGDRAFGPCVDERARIGNTAHADAAISIHADGAPAGDRGFHVILPAPVHEGRADTRAITGPSRELGERVAGRFAHATGSAPSNYIGGGTGLDVRADLGGLNLSRVPKVFIECGNMRDTHDAAEVTSGAWRQKAAQGISEGIMSFLHG